MGTPGDKPMPLPDDVYAISKSMGPAKKAPTPQAQKPAGKVAVQRQNPALDPLVGRTLVEAEPGEDKIPSGTGIISYVKKHIKAEMVENPDSALANSPAVKAVLGMCNFLEGIFGFALTPGQFASLIDLDYPDASLSKEELEEVLKNNKINRLIRDYKELQRNLEAGAFEDEQVKLVKNQELLGIKSELEKLGVDPDNMPDPENKDLLARYKTSLETALSEKGTQPDDEYTSAHYVSGQLGLMNEGVVPTYNPKDLYARLKNTTYDDHAVGKRYPLFHHEESRGDFVDKFKAGGLPTGTVVFFKRPLAQEGKLPKQQLISGIIGGDGVIRFNTTKGLGRMKSGVDADEKSKKATKLTEMANTITGVGDALIGNSLEAEETLDLDINYLTGTTLSTSVVNLGGAPFVGAFIPVDETNAKEGSEESYNKKAKEAEIEAEAEKEKKAEEEAERLENEKMDEELKKRRQDAAKAVVPGVQPSPEEEPAESKPEVENSPEKKEGDEAKKEQKPDESGVSQ